MAHSGEALTVDVLTTSEWTSRPPALECRTLGVGEYLYKEAEPRAYVYRVEKGAIAIFERRIGRPAQMIEIASQGDYFGLGCLEQHRDNARAVVSSSVSVMTRDEVALLARHDSKLRLKQDAAIERDFEHGKLLANGRGRAAPVESVAAFLVAVSRQNAHEGRDPAVVSDSLTCGTVATLLDLDVSVLGRALLKLHDMGLVEQYPAESLYLRNINALEGIADGDLQAIDGMSGEGPIDSPRVIARQLERPKSSGPVSSWGDELREAMWLLSAIGGLSFIGVGLAVVIAMVLL